MPAPGLKRVEEIFHHRRSIALQCEIHMAVSHRASLGDDPRLAGVASRDLPHGSGARRPEPEEEDPDFPVCGDCGDEHARWKPCASDLGKITGVAR